MHEFVESEQITIGQIIHAVRVAVTGMGSLWILPNLVLNRVGIEIHNCCDPIRSLRLQLYLNGVILDVEVRSVISLFAYHNEFVHIRLSQVESHIKALVVTSNIDS